MVHAAFIICGRAKVSIHLFVRGRACADAAPVWAARRGFWTHFVLNWKDEEEKKKSSTAAELLRFLNKHRCVPNFCAGGLVYPCGDVTEVAGLDLKLNPVPIPPVGTKR